MFTMNVIRPFLQNELKYRVFSEADFTLGQGVYVIFQPLEGG